MQSREERVEKKVKKIQEMWNIRGFWRLLRDTTWLVLLKQTGNIAFVVIGWNWNGQCQVPESDIVTAYLCGES